MVPRCSPIKDLTANTMKRLIAAVFALIVPLASASERPPVCAQCQVILKDIRASLESRCASVPTDEALRQQPVYLFLSIFGEVSQGIDKSMRERIYSAALQGMECGNLDAGVEAAQKMSKKLMTEHRS